MFLCFVRPRGDPGFLASPLSLSSHLDNTPTKHSMTGSPYRLEPLPSKAEQRPLDLTRESRGTMAGSWSPGDPIWVHTNTRR